MFLQKFLNVLDLHNTIMSYPIGDSFNNNAMLWIDVIAYYGFKEYVNNI